MKLRVGCKRKMHRDRPFRYPRALPSLDSASFRRDSEEGNGCGCSRMLRQLEIFVSWSRVEFVMRCSTDFFFFFFSFSKFHVSWHSRCELFLIGLDRFGTLEIREDRNGKIGMGSENERFKDISLKSHSWDFQRDFRFDHFILGTKYISYI